MPSPARTSVLAAGALVAGLLSACALDVPDVFRPGPAPRLEARWTVPGLGLRVEEPGANHWLSDQVRRDGVGWGTTYTYLGTRVVDARSGEVRLMEQRDDLTTCLGPDVVSANGLAPLLVTPANTRPAPTTPDRCTQLALLDASTGEVRVVVDDLDLRGLSPELALAVDEQVAAVVDVSGRAVCHRLDDGTRVDDGDPGCESLATAITGADLPTLLDPDGRPVSLSSRFHPDVDTRELGRTGEVILVRDFVEEERPDGSLTSGYVVRAHDLETGETLWQDDDLTPDPYVGDSWSREETYFVAPSGIARVSYVHPDQVAVVASTPMVVTAVDPRTGEHLEEVARINGGWFAHQFSDVTVALTDQDLQLRATISGFQLPRW